MQPRTLKALALVLLALAAAWGARLGLRRMRTQVPPLLADAERVVQLDIHRPGKRHLSLVRRGAGWRLAQPFDFPADGSAVEDLLKSLSKARVSEPLSADPGQLPHFDLSDVSGMRVQAWVPLASGQELGLDLLVGRTGVSWDSFFAVLGGESAVREVRGLARGRLDRGPLSYADLVVCALDPSRVRSIELRRRSGRLRIRRVKGRWFQGGGAGIPVLKSEVAAKIDPLLTTLARFKADSVKPDSEVHPFVLRGLSRPEIRARIEHLGPRGETVATELVIGAREPGFQHPVRRADLEGFVYEMKPYKIDPFRIDL